MNKYLSENFVISQMRTLVKTESAYNLQDDVASISGNFIVSCDTINEDTHFFSNMDAKYVAKRLFRSNISDIISKAALPKYYTLSLTLSSNRNKDWLENFVESLKEEQETYSCYLIGGDTTFAPITSLSMTVFGSHELQNLTEFQDIKREVKGNFPQQFQAMPGDDIYVTGYIGTAFIARIFYFDECRYNIWSKDEWTKILQEYHSPSLPHNTQIQNIFSYANASTDISDGLITDLESICTASNVLYSLDFQAIPIMNSIKNFIASCDFSSYHPELKEFFHIINSGDDYQALFTASPKYKKILENQENISRIGKIMAP